MVVKLFLFLLVLFSYKNSDVDPLIHKALLQKYEEDYFDECQKFKDTMTWLDVNVKACMKSTLKGYPDLAPEDYRIICAGQYNSILHYTYTKNLRILQRKFMTYLVSYLDPFRARFNNEMMYLSYLMKFFIFRDLKIKEGIEVAQKTIKYQVKERNFEIMLGIIEERVDEFTEFQARIISMKNDIKNYLDTQIQSLMSLRNSLAEDVLDDNFNETELVDSENEMEALQEEENGEMEKGKQEEGDEEPKGENGER